MDDVDITADRIQAEEDALVAATRAAAAAIPAGEAGICDYCEEHFSRLVKGVCGRCRDEYKLF